MEDFIIQVNEQVFIVQEFKHEPVGSAFRLLVWKTLQNSGVQYKNVLFYWNFVVKFGPAINESPYTAVRPANDDKGSILHCMSKLITH